MPDRLEPAEVTSLGYGMDGIAICVRDYPRLRWGPRILPPTSSIREAMLDIGDPAWPVERLLLTLAQAADHLEHGMGWDGHGWETVRTAVRVAAAYLANRMPNDIDLGTGPATPDVEAFRGKPFGRMTRGGSEHDG